MAKKTAQQFADTAPPLNDAEREAINSLFQAYVFRRNGTGEIWTTCCHKHLTVQELPDSKSAAEAMSHPHQPEGSGGIFSARRCDPPKPEVCCPVCGRPVIVKELRYSGKRQNLSGYRRALALRWYRGALWARAYDCGKHYTDGYALTGYPKVKLVGVYRFRPGRAEEATRPWWGTHEFQYIDVQDGPLEKGKWHVHEPFNWNSEEGLGYAVVGMDELQKSPFRWCMAAKYKAGGSSFAKFLTACCIYPRQIEMLMKAGMSDVVADLVERGVKHALAIDWSKEKPTESFGLTKQELNAFLAGKRNIETVELYKRLHCRVPMAEVAGWTAKYPDIRRTFCQTKKWHIPPEKLFRYLAAHTEPSGLGARRTLDGVLRYWVDYLTAAEATGYPLHRENVLLPHDLIQAHDEASKKYRAVLERRRKEEARRRAEAERLRKEEELKRMEEARAEYEKYRAELDKKYGFQLSGMLIRAPAGKDEILDEGRALKHCVGGYADRHIMGKTVILFMRQVKSPDKPWITIEMDGIRLRQIHGYQNDIHGESPRTAYKDFVDTWLEWLKAGSKRDKQGRPRLPAKAVAA